MTDPTHDRLPITDELLPPHAHAISMVRRAVYIGLAIAFIVLGIIFWLLPVLTGVPFWMVGLFFLARTSERVRRAVNWADLRLPYRLRMGLRWARAKFGIAPMPSAAPTTPPDGDGPVPPTDSAPQATPPSAHS